MIEDTFQELIAACQRQDWDGARAAAARVAAAYAETVRDDPEMVDVLFERSGDGPLGAAAAAALAAGRLAFADELLGCAGKRSSRLEPLQTGLTALCAGDGEAAAVSVLITRNDSDDAWFAELREAIGRRAVGLLDGGSWTQRIVAAELLGRLVQDAQEAHAEAQRWANDRELLWARSVRDFAVASLCLRRSGPAALEVTARLRERLVGDAPQLADQIVVAAQHALAHGSTSYTVLRTALRHHLEGGRPADAERLVKAFTTDPSRQAFARKILDEARREVPPLAPPAPVAVLDVAERTRDLLGDFAVTVPVLTIGDPGYRGDRLDLHRPVVAVRLGRWQAVFARARDGEALALIAHHPSHAPVLTDVGWISLGGIDVEYGLAGVFDAARYYLVDGARVPRADAVEHPWFKGCVATGTGVIDGGCVAATPDATYDGYQWRDRSGDVTAVVIDLCRAR